VPIQHVLAKSDVGPKNGEGQHPFPHDVIMLESHYFEVARLSQRGGDKHEQRHRTTGGAGKNVRAPHGGVPAKVQAHHPIKGGKGQGQAKDRKPGKGYFAHPNGAAWIAIAVLGDRKAAQEKGHATQKDKIENSAQKEERPVKVQSFAVERGILTGW